MICGVPKVPVRHAKRTDRTTMSSTFVAANAAAAVLTVSNTR
jgi:hypothetical protein